MRLLLPCWVALAATLRAAAPSHTVSLIADPHLGPPAQHGLVELTRALQTKGWKVVPTSRAESATGDWLVFANVAAAPEAVKSGREPKQALDGPESLQIRKFTFGGKPALLLAGADDRGLMYAELDTAERVGWSTDPTDPFTAVRDITERPFIQDRELSVYTMNRAYWESRFYDEAYWTRYFDLLAADRFCRFLIIFGYENGGFLAPPYPYFFNTTGYPGVHMVDLTPEQQRRNLAALNRLIELAHERGIAVSLGIWDHIYRAGVQTGGAEWLKDYAGRPVPNTVEGVTTDNLSAYTLASLKELLARVPKLDGLQFRIHEESGLKRSEMDGFWRVVFTEMKKLRPDLLIEARAKGTPDSVINTALDLGLNLRVETKYWMEQMGLPFHPIHVNPPDQHNRRHGYADLLRYPQRYHIDWRLWNGGTSRVLLWGDPEYVRRYDRTTLLYQSPIFDVQEPLATKMEAQRPDLAPFDLMPAKYRYYDYEFERYWYFYQLWGRLGYNPDTSADLWQHEFANRFGPAGSEVATGLRRASEVLPMIVTAVYPYRLFPTTRGWAERQSLGAKLSQYASNEGTDTELIESFADAAKRILAGGVTAKRTPLETSRWFDATADAILASVRAAQSKFAPPSAGTIAERDQREFESTMTDLRILAQLARFHARRAIAAVHYNLYRDERQQMKAPKSGLGADAGAAELIAATQSERAAVDAWRQLVQDAGDHYTFDLAMGARDFDLCGHWRDEFVKLEADLNDLEAQCQALPPTQAKAWTPPEGSDQQPPVIEHQRIATAYPGRPIRIVAHVTAPSGVRSVIVKYRHVTQFEDYSTLVLAPTGQPGTYAGTIPGDAISPEWDFMYFLEAIDGAGNGTIWPDPMKEMPYVIVRTHPASP
ncbi:MAG TPA: hypothetical protein VHE61_07095 [Opitutaceae bacterium]|nr:hypothetical protein [Opitutaceae bacterium]